MRSYVDVAAIETQLRLQVGDEIFDSLPDAPGRAAHASFGQGATEHPSSRTIAPRAFPRRPRPCRSPDAQASFDRRRKLGHSGPLPPSVNHRFTLGETAVMRIVLDEIRDHGRCELALDCIAARSGTSRATVRRALRAASIAGVVAIQERRVSTFRNLPNVVTVISFEVRTWMFKGGRQKWRGTDTRYSNAVPETAASVSPYRRKRLSEGRPGAWRGG